MKQNLSFFLIGLAAYASSPLQTASAQSPVPPNSVVEQIAQGFQFVEGPVWSDGALLFSDIPGNTVYRWTQANGSTVYYEPSSNSNGLALDADGRLLLAQHGSRQVVRLENDGTESRLATHFNSLSLNSPNDIAVHSDGSIYFTDPPWGISANQQELSFMGVFQIAPDGSLHLLVDSLFYPNGIAFSPDESTLYVSTSHGLTVVAYDVAEHVLTNGRIFATLTGSGAADGMKVDADGLLYVTGPGGVWIYAPDGALLDKIAVPEQTTNLAWGDADGQTLYITSGSGVYRIRLGTPLGVDENFKSGHPRTTSEIFPNPTTGATTMRFELSETGTVRIKIVDVLGRTRQVIDGGFLPAGTAEVVVDFSELPASRYVYVIETRQQSVLGSVIRTR